MKSICMPSSDKMPMKGKTDMRSHFWQLPKVWGITIVQDRCLTDDFSIFGETRFSARDVEPYDFFTLPRIT